jgi:succinate dehydrogenase / fumarate reductase, iron-sulfur subunit
MRAKLSICRFNPDIDKESRYEPFEIEVEQGETVLAALVKIYEEQDPSLSFRFACAKLKCGECGVLVNKVPCLACERKVEPEMTIEPLPNLPVTKDLVVDRDKVLKNIFRLAPPLQKGPDSARAKEEMSNEDFDNYIKLTSCLECLMCQSSCPVLKKKSDQFVGPLGLLWLAQMKALGSKQEEMRRLAEMCTGCGKCWKACPSKVDFLEDAITELLDKEKE